MGTSLTHLIICPCSWPLTPTSDLSPFLMEPCTRLSCAFVSGQNGKERISRIASSWRTFPWIWQNQKMSATSRSLSPAGLCDLEALCAMTIDLRSPRRLRALQAFPRNRPSIMGPRRLRKAEAEWPRSPKARPRAQRFPPTQQLVKKQPRQPKLAFDV